MSPVSSQNETDQLIFDIFITEGPRRSSYVMRIWKGEHECTYERVGLNILINPLTAEQSNDCPGAYWITYLGGKISKC